MQAIQTQASIGKMSLTQRSTFSGKSVAVARVSPKAKSAFKLNIVAAKELVFEVEKPLGLTFGPKSGKEGGVIVKAAKGNSASAGMKAGDQVIYHSSFFGDELWPADNVPFTNTAVKACPGAVDFIVIRGADIGTVNVKRLPKRPAPEKFARKLTEAQKSRATHLCIDCGFIYYLPTPFAEQPGSYICPQCQAPKSRFLGYDPETGKTIGSGGLPPVVAISLGLGLVLAAVFVYVGLEL
mmetsp:Transcript_5133/g.8923  ORF Transcript_5133/g.8923 Transcript_5133/m.8923 type:complete len:239 (-) Transcript_5133:153-869(-)|eukprot:CAMPEP_0198204482 /NCGR_PEP_ID=MMETSP1445-20131203/7895_1 /TAXON_ID=36898 /ORGANISM="Pyramimonas sp., Strain CCMP2087" /LENGTH=238 /DNA_ID=CAMNT_0043876377 /DNA_START=120 /DNA_END=836 /DNA_ORIENTATION=-